MKTLALALAMLFVLAQHVKAQNTPNISNPSRYAILKCGKYYGDYYADLFLDNNKTANLMKALKLDTISSTDDYISYFCVIKCLNYMETQGYELVSSSDIKGCPSCNPIREFIFRRKD